MTEQAYFDKLKKDSNLKSKSLRAGITVGLAFILMILADCKDSLTETPTPLFDFKSSVDTVIITVKVTDYSFFMNHVTYFVGDTIDVELIVTSYKSGSADFNLNDAANKTFVSYSLIPSNTGVTQVLQHPSYFSISFTNWIGEAKVKAIGH